MKRFFTKCEICGKNISNNNLKRHLEGHSAHPENYVPRKYKLTHEGLSCKFCGKECKNRNSLCNHERLCKKNPERILHGFVANINEVNKRKIPWNKGLTKETDERLKNMGENYSKKVKEGEITPSFKGRHHSEESKRKCALTVAGNTRGNNSKKGYYKGIWCGSSYELIYLIYCLDHNIKISKCQEHYEYFYNGSKHLYFPDFVVNNIIIEIKGYHTNLVDIKAAAVSNKEIKILYKKDLKKEFKYVFDTYNVNEKTVSTLYDKEE